MPVIELAVTALATATVASVAAMVASRRGRPTAGPDLTEATLAAEKNARLESEALCVTLLAEAQELADTIRKEARSDAVAAQAELESEDARLEARGQAIDRLRTELDERSKEIDQQFDALRLRAEVNTSREKELSTLAVQAQERVESAAQQTRQVALEHLRQEHIEQSSVAAQKAARLAEEFARGNAELAARRLIDLACQRYGQPLPTERLVATVTLPTPGPLRERIVADSAALLQVITAATEVEFLTKDDGDTLVLQAPDPYKREVGRLVFERLLKERSPNEASVQKLATKVAADLERTVRGAGQKAAEVLKVQKVHPEILFLVGKLLYRTSYTQNQWAHAIESAFLCGMIAEDMGINPIKARRSALIHDIGKVLWAETEAVGSHAVSGAAFARAHGEPEDITHPIAAHHNDEKPSTVLAHIVAASDALSGARPGARRATEEAFSTRVEDLERICYDFPGIDSHFVIQGGRELRIVVDHQRVGDLEAARLSSAVATRIEDELTYPGQIKVTVIRETRVSAVARY